MMEILKRWWNINSYTGVPTEQMVSHCADQIVEAAEREGIVLHAGAFTALKDILRNHYGFEQANPTECGKAIRAVLTEYGAPSVARRWFSRPRPLDLHPTAFRIDLTRWAEFV